jgi:hypothetical protein
MDAAFSAGATRFAGQGRNAMLARATSFDHTGVAPVYDRN